ncbi:hypothetical protein ACROYT_G041314 [Oculina patagonica]
MSSTSASATIKALRGLFATHGLPEEIVADNVPQFIAGEIKDFLTANGVRLCLSSPYHPSSNGEAERAVRTFKEAMKVMKNEPEILMGRRLRTRLELLRPDLSSRMEQKSRKLSPLVQRAFEVGEPVMVKDYRNRVAAWTKGVVQDRLGPVTYRVQVGERLWKRHVDQLRELAGSKVADVETKSYELPEIVLPEAQDASVSVSTQDLPQQSAPNETTTTPLVEVSSPVQIAPQEELGDTDNSGSTFPEVVKRRSTRVRSKPKRLIEEM